LAVLYAATYCNGWAERGRGGGPGARLRWHQPLPGDAAAAAAAAGIPSLPTASIR